jgi:hypothetical protein
MHGSILGYRILLDYVFFCALKGAVVGNWIYIYLIDTIGDFYKNVFARCVPEVMCIRYSFCNEKYN